MLNYLFKRTLSFIFILWLILTANFFLLRYLPGSAFEEERPLDQVVKKQLEIQYQLDETLWVQYQHYFLSLLKGHFGKSYFHQGYDVGAILKESFTESLKLGFVTLLVCYSLGIFLGFIGFLYHNKWPEKFVVFFCVLGASLPNFLVAAFAILLFSLQLKWLPVALWGTPSHFILPVMCLSLRPMAFIAQLTYFNFVDQIKEPYVQTAFSKGLSVTQVLFKHILRNAILPVLSYSGSLFSGILTGSFVVEKIFAIPGLGSQMTLSIFTRDYPLILACVFIFSFILCFVNYLIDLSYLLLDPRIKYEV